MSIQFQACTQNPNQGNYISLQLLSLLDQKIGSL